MDAVNTTDKTSNAAAPSGQQRVDKDYAYGQYTAAYYGGLLEKQTAASHQLRLKRLDRCLEPAAGDRFVDLGCGAGLVAHHLLKKGCEVHGVDLAEEAIKAAVAINASFPKGHFRVGDASKCDHLEGGTFDKACSVDVIEHCGHDVMLDIFGEAHRLLKPGGLYYVYTPNPRHWIERLKDWGVMKQDVTHTGLRLVGPVVEGLNAKGFEVVERLRPASFIAGFNWLERAWSVLPGVGELGVYRIAVLARKK